MNVDNLLRVYWDEHEIVQYGDKAGYPKAWVNRTVPPGTPADVFVPQDQLLPRIPDYVREQAGHRCIRCGHPYVVGETPGEWSPCDEQCTHAGPLALMEDYLLKTQVVHVHVNDSRMTPREVLARPVVQERLKDHVLVAQWRVLTVHHLNSIKHDCRWWNLLPLDQRCHLVIQGKVRLERPWIREHSDWFKPYVAGYYAWSILGEELTREETMARLDELLALQQTHDRLFEV